MTIARRFDWSTTNKKLHATQEAWERRFGGRTRFIGFSLPQLKSKTGRVVCPYAGSCADICYASQSTYYMPHVQAMYERNLAELRLNRTAVKAAAALLEDLSELRIVTHVRLHDSGDFFAPWYVRAWTTVAEEMPNTIFYGYTKSLPLIDFDALPGNLRLTQSLGGKRDDMVDLSRSHSRIFATGDDRRAAGYENGNLDDMLVLLRTTKIGLVYHGTRILRDEQIVQLRSHS